MDKLKIGKVIIAVLAIVIVVLLGILIFYPAKKPSGGGAPNMLTSSDGHLQVAATPDEKIASPADFHGTVTGGGWIFEAVFPVEVLDGSGAVIGTGQARAESDWTSSGTVPWSASVTFSVPRTATGTVLFMKDNPSGNPANAGELRVPVAF